MYGQVKEPVKLARNSMLKDIRHYKANITTSVIEMYGLSYKNDTVVYCTPFWVDKWVYFWSRP